MPASDVFLIIHTFALCTIRFDDEKFSNHDPYHFILIHCLPLPIDAQEQHLRDTPTTVTP